MSGIFTIIEEMKEHLTLIAYNIFYDEYDINLSNAINNLILNYRRLNIGFFCKPS